MIPARGEPPAQVLTRMLVAPLLAQAIHVAAKLGIAEALAAGPRTAEDLASAAKVDGTSLYRVLRALASAGIFREIDGDRTFAMTPLAEPLRKGSPGSVHDFAVFFGDDVHWRPYTEILHSVRTGEPAFDKVWGAPAFAYFAKRREKADIFDAAMTSLSEQWAAPIASAYPWDRFKTVADVGGGHGALLCAILRTAPALRGILFDLPHVIEGARRRIDGEGLSGRCQLVPGDFFDSAPKGADCIVSKSCVHDWDDERALTILQNCQKALPPGGKLLLVEAVLEPGNAPDFGKILDIEMLVMAGGRERTEAEFARLYEEAGFRLERVVRTECPLSIIEGSRT